MRAGLIGFAVGAATVVLVLYVARLSLIAHVAPTLGYHFDAYVFPDDYFPGGDFDQGRVVRRCLYPAQVTTTFYNAQFEVVTKPTKPGRYGAVVRIALDGGVVTYRYITLFHTPEKIYWWDASMPATVQFPTNAGVDPVVVRNQPAEIGKAYKLGFGGDGDLPGLAILLAGLSEMSPTDPPAVERTGTTARDIAWWYTLREKLGLAPTYKFLVDLPEGYAADPSKKWPLILYLHSVSEIGDDLSVVRHSGLAGEIERGRKLPTIVLSPQRGAEEDWNIHALSKLLDDISGQYHVDPDRIYLYGTSAGGDFAFNLAMAYPERFAALVSMAGDPDEFDAAQLAHLPLWDFQGGKDTVVYPSRVQALIENLRKAGGHPHFSFYPDSEHYCWGPALKMDLLYQWMLAQKRGQPEVSVPGMPSN